MEKTKLFIDKDVHDKLAAILRNLGYDAINARESGRKGKTDIEQLKLLILRKKCFFPLTLLIMKNLP